MNMKSRIVATVLIAAFGVSELPTMSQAASRGYCQAYARKEANRRAHAGHVLGDAAAGAVAGAVLGAIIGGRHSVGDGALIGGIGGATLGGISTNKKWHRVYNQAYANCRTWR